MNLNVTGPHRRNYKPDFYELGNDRVAPVRFDSVTVWGWNGSRGSGFRFRRFLQGGVLLCFSTVLAVAGPPCFNVLSTVCIPGAL